MRMSPYQLIANSPRYIIKVVAPFLLSKLPVEDHLKEQVSQFFLQMHPVLSLDRIDSFIGLLN